MALRPYRSIILLVFPTESKPGTGFDAEHQSGQCQARLGLFCNEDGCERPDEATTRDAEKHSSKEKPEAGEIGVPQGK